jgi:hypothetical protein
MNNRILTRELVVGEKRYQLKKIDARSACWLFSFLASKSNGSTLVNGLGVCTRQEFDEITSLVLKPVVCLDHSEDGQFELAVIAPNGIIPDSNLDAGNLFKLISESIVFNLEPFLAEKGSNSPQLTSAGGNL